MSLTNRLRVVVVAVMLALIAPAAAIANTDVATEESIAERHCVVEVVDQLKSGEYVVSDPVCYRSFAEAMREASSGALILDAKTPASSLLVDTELAAALATFTLGVHYDGLAGSGSSITVVGSSCSGGYWNTPSWWDNRISSSWNGCYRLKHHDLPNRGGSYASTYGVGDLDNVPYFLNNKAESISYWS